MPSQKVRPTPRSLSRLARAREGGDLGDGPDTSKVFLATCISPSFSDTVFEKELPLIAAYSFLVFVFGYAYGQTKKTNTIVHTNTNVTCCI